jgi:HlyD family secretion protein
MRGKKKLIIAGALVAVLAVLAYLGVNRRWGRSQKAIRVSGNIEVTDVELAFKIPGRVMERLVDEGETVKAGQVVARLDTGDLAQEVAGRRGEVRAAQAVLAEMLAGSRPEEIGEAEGAAQQAEARLKELEAGSRVPELAAAEASFARAKAEADRARADYERYAGLYKRSIVSAQQFDAVRTAYETANAHQEEVKEQLKLVREGPRKEQIEQARAALIQAKERHLLAKKGPRQETIDQARARLEQAKSSLALAETRLGYATLYSPLAGVVLSKNTEPGEYVAPGTPIVTAGDLEHVWLRAYINETDLGRVKLGQHARVKTDTYSGKWYQGRISFISSQAEFTPRNVQTEKERVKLVYRVKIDIENPRMELKPGMPADAEIVVGTEPRGK